MVQVAAVFLVWAPVEDWEAVDGSPDSVEKVLQAVRSHLLNKVAGTATGSVEWIFLTILEENMDCAIGNAAPVLKVQRLLEELEQCILVSPLKNPASLTARW